MIQIAAIFITDEQHPTEVQEWFDSHPGIVVLQVAVQHDIFYIIYN